MVPRRSVVQILVLVIALALLPVLLSVVPFEQIEYWAVDLGYYRAAALALRAGADPYVQENLFKYAGGARIDEMLLYTYAPIFALFLRPLTWLPFYLATRVWLLVNICLLAGSIYLIARALAWELTARRFLVLLLGAVCFVPVVHALVPGQATIFVLFWLVAAFYLVKQGGDVWAGVCLGLCFTKLQILALVPLLLLLQRRWKLLGGFSATLLLSTVPFWRLWPSWLEAIQRTTRITVKHRGYLNQPCLSAVARLLVKDSLAWTLLVGIGTAGLLAAVIWLGIRSGRGRRQEFDRAFAIAIAASLLTAGYVRTHDLVLLLVPFAVVLDRSAVLSSSPAERALLVYAAIAFALPYALLLASVFVPVFKASMWHISSTVGVLVALVACGQDRPANQTQLNQAC